MDIEKLKKRCGYDGKPQQFKYGFDLACRELVNTVEQAAKAQAVPEQDQQVWATNNLTWKDIAFRALSCKVLKTTQNWVHVKNIACVGSTTASLICKKLGVDPDGTKFELIEAQEPAND